MFYYIIYLSIQKEKIFFEGDEEIMDMSDKTKIVYAAMDKLGAINSDNKITSYAILDYIVEEEEELKTHELLQEMDEDDYIELTLSASIKGINASINSLARKDAVIKTEPRSIKIDGTTRSLREYYLKK